MSAVPNSQLGFAGVAQPDDEDDFETVLAKARETQRNRERTTKARIEGLEQQLEQARRATRSFYRSLRDQFAMNAPPMPEWYAQSHADSERLFDWPYFYAERVLARREPPAVDPVAEGGGA